MPKTRESVPLALLSQLWLLWRPVSKGLSKIDFIFRSFQFGEGFTFIVSDLIYFNFKEGFKSNMFSRAGSSKGFSAAPPRGLSIQVFLQVYIYMANLLTGVVISNSVFRGGKLLEKLLFF